MTDEPHKAMRTFGRIKGRPLRPGRASLLGENLPGLGLDLSGPLDTAAIMPGARQTWLELGFGAGEHMAAQAAANPDVLVIGAEPFVNGVASALRHVHDQELANVRIHAGDGREVMAALADGSIGRVYVLFPDPWPKTRHHKRRLLSAETIAELARVMAHGAELRFASDWADYVDWTLQRFLADPDFEWTAQGPDDWRLPPADHVTTRYEQKRLGDCAPVFLNFVRR